MKIPKPTAADRERFAALVPDAAAVEVKPMFGNLGAFVNGNMFMGLFGADVGVKLANEDRVRLLADPGAGPFGPAERPMAGYVTLPANWSFETGHDLDGTGPRPCRRIATQAAEEVREAATVMTVDVTTEIVIDRPVVEVSAYASDPSNAPVWYENIDSVEWKTPPPAQPGSKVAFVAHFLGMRLAYTYEFVELVPGERLVMRTRQGPFPMETTYSWSTTPGGTTRMTLRNRGTPAGFSTRIASVLELVGTPTLPDTLAATRVHGVVCFTGMLSNQWTVREFYPIDYLPRGVRLTAYGGDASDLPPEVLQSFLDDVAAGRALVPLAHAYRLDEIVEAHTVLEQGGAGGKLVVMP